MVAILAQYCINVADMDRAISFWNGVCGIPVVRHTDLGNIREAILQSPHGGSRMQLAEWDEHAGQAVDMGTALWKLYVNTDDCQALYDKAIAAGCESVMPPTRLEQWPTKMAYVKDFDGYLVEFVEYEEGTPDGVPDPKAFAE
jgi:lactoylglutathione lyase